MLQQPGLAVSLPIGQLLRRSSEQMMRLQPAFSQSVLQQMSTARVDIYGTQADERSRDWKQRYLRAYMAVHEISIKLKCYRLLLAEFGLQCLNETEQIFRERKWFRGQVKITDNKAGTIYCFSSCRQP